MYVVYGCEHLRDGQEEFAKILPTIDAAMEYINKDRFASQNHTYRLFELGKEIPIGQQVVEEQEKVVVKSHVMWFPVDETTHVKTTLRLRGKQ